MSITQLTKYLLHKNFAGVLIVFKYGPYVQYSEKMILISFSYLVNFLSSVHVLRLPSYGNTHN